MVSRGCRTCEAMMKCGKEEYIARMGTYQELIAPHVAEVELDAKDQDLSGVAREVLMRIATHRDYCIIKEPVMHTKRNPENHMARHNSP